MRSITIQDVKDWTLGKATDEVCLAIDADLKSKDSRVREYMEWVGGEPSRSTPRLVQDDFNTLSPRVRDALENLSFDDDDVEVTVHSAYAVPPQPEAWHLTPVDPVIQSPAQSSMSPSVAPNGWVGVTSGLEAKERSDIGIVLPGEQVEDATTRPEEPPPTIPGWRKDTSSRSAPHSKKWKRALTSAIRSVAPLSLLAVLITVFVHWSVDQGEELEFIGSPGSSRSMMENPLGSAKAKRRTAATWPPSTFLLTGTGSVDFVAWFRKRDDGAYAGIFCQKDLKLTLGCIGRMRTENNKQMLIINDFHHIKWPELTKAEASPSDKLPTQGRLTVSSDNSKFIGTVDGADVHGKVAF